MLHLIRNNSPYTVIILFIFTLLIKLQALSAPVAPEVFSGQFFYGFIVYLLQFVFSGSAFAYTMFAAIITFGQALYLNNIVIRQKIFAKPTYSIAFLFILLSSLSPWLSYFNPVLLVNCFLLAALGIMLRLNQTAHPRKNLFNIGFLLSLAALVHFPAVLFGLLMLLALLMLRSFNPGEWIVGLLGFVTPIYFVVSILFLFDRLYMLTDWPDWHFWFPTADIADPVYTGGVIAGLAVLLLSGIFALQRQMVKTSVFARRKWSFVGMYIILSILVVLGTDRGVSGAWLATIPPLSLVMVQPLYMEKNKRFSNFIFYFSLIFVIFCQLAVDI